MLMQAKLRKVEDIQNFTPIVEKAVAFYSEELKKLSTDYQTDLVAAMEKKDNYAKKMNTLRAILKLAQIMEKKLLRSDEVFDSVQAGL